MVVPFSSGMSGGGGQSIRGARLGLIEAPWFRRTLGTPAQNSADMVVGLIEAPWFRRTARSNGPHPRRARLGLIEAAGSPPSRQASSAADRNADQMPDAVGDGGGGEADQELAHRGDQKAAPGEERGPGADEDERQPAAGEARE